jgi:predicted RNase H-like nuclease (RuvC/YqgF family)
MPVEKVEVKESDNKTFTQDEVDGIVSERLKREKNQLGDKLKAFSNLEKQVANFEKEKQDLTASIEKLTGELTEKDTRIKAYEINELKLNALKDVGLSSDYKDNITGDDVDTIKVSAKKLKDLINTSTSKVNNNISILTKNDPEKSGSVIKKDKWLKMASELKNENT